MYWFDPDGFLGVFTPSIYFASSNVGFEDTEGAAVGLCSDFGAFGLLQGAALNARQRAIRYLLCLTSAASTPASSALVTTHRAKAIMLKSY